MKSKLVGKEHYDALDIKNWDVEVAYPSNDIIWTELNKSKNRIFPIRLLLNLIPFILSIAVILIIMYLDLDIKILPDILRVGLKYILPIALCYFVFYTIP